MSSKAFIIDKIKKRVALGNSNRGFKEVASDLLHATGEKPVKIADGTFLSAATIARVMDCPDEYRPQADTLERIFKYCNAEVNFEHVVIKAKYSNKPKEAI